MTDYTPTMLQVAATWMLGTGGDRASFDRWLNAERARVWDECHAALSDFWDGPDWASEPTNPYRQGGDDA